MGRVLVHAQGGGEHAAPHDGDARQLQQALYGAVLPVLAMEHREGGVQVHGGRPGGGDQEQAVDAPVGGDHGGDQMALIGVPAVVQQGVKGAPVEEPPAVPGDAQGHRFVFPRIQVGEHRVGGLEGNVVFRGTTAEQDGQLPLFHADYLPKRLRFFVYWEV